MSGEIDRVFANLDTSLVKFKREWGVEALQRVENRTPVLTGALKRGWGFEMKAKDIEIYNTKDYAEYVEYGTPHMAPVGMLRATLNEAEQISEVAAKKAGLK
jgi:hypothetical protein